MGRLNTIYSLMKRVVKTSSCWEWNGPLGWSGYGYTTVKQKKKLAHRAIYEMLESA